MTDREEATHGRHPRDRVGLEEGRAPTTTAVPHTRFEPAGGGDAHDSLDSTGEQRGSGAHVTVPATSQPGVAGTDLTQAIQVAIDALRREEGPYKQWAVLALRDVPEQLQATRDQLADLGAKTQRLEAENAQLRAAAEQRRQASRKGGKRRLETLTPKQRSDIARKAAVVRWNRAALDQGGVGQEGDR